MKINEVDERDAANFRRGIVSGVAVFNHYSERLRGKLSDRAIEIVQNITCSGELSVSRGEYFVLFGVMSKSDDDLAALTQLMQGLDKAGIGFGGPYLAVPVRQLQSDVEVVDGVAKRTFCSCNGILVKTTRRDGTWMFDNGSFWLIQAEASVADGTKFTAYELEQSVNGDGEYQFAPKCGTDGQPIIKTFSSEKALTAGTRIAERFLEAMMRPIYEELQRQKEAGQLRKAVGGNLQVNLSDLGIKISKRR